MKRPGQNARGVFLTYPPTPSLGGKGGSTFPRLHLLQRGERVAAMPVKNIVRGQTVSARQLEGAKELRRDMTPAERILWKHLKANRLNGLHFRRQQIVHGYFADFLCHQYDLIVEVDGEIHDLQKEYDAQREGYLKSLGFRIIRFENEEVIKNLNRVLQRIIEECSGPIPRPLP
jgi:very-short-patch-repair endonuclease